jgi:hypothetical protein
MKELDEQKVSQSDRQPICDSYALRRRSARRHGHDAGVEHEHVERTGETRRRRGRRAQTRAPMAKSFKSITPGTKLTGLHSRIGGGGGANQLVDQRTLPAPTTDTAQTHALPP